MGLMDRLRGELIDIIEWTDDSRDTLAWRFPRHQNEIKSGAKLIVREGQAAVFVDKGRLADVFEPGTYTLDTANLPILSTLEGWKYGFESPFKAEVYFIRTTRVMDQKWGTKNPIMLRDPEFGPTRLRAFGTYGFKVSDPATFLDTLVGTSGDVDTGAITDQIRNLIVARFTDVLGSAKLAALDLAAFVLGDGRRIAIIEHWEHQSEESRSLASAHDAACGMFNTVLGPDYNVLHADHIHIDTGRIRTCR